MKIKNNPPTLSLPGKKNRGARIRTAVFYVSFLPKYKLTIASGAMVRK
jgi:hypothetical protein